MALLLVDISISIKSAFPLREGRHISKGKLEFQLKISKLSEARENMPNKSWLILVLQLIG